MTLETVNWGRTYTLEVGKNLGDGTAAGLSVDALRIVFQVEQNLRGPPNTANLAVYNLNPSNSAKIKKEFDEVRLTCGYRGNPRIIFWGNIKFTSTYREGTDWVTEIAAADGDKAYTEAHVYKPLSPGQNAHAALDEIIRSMPGIRKGHIELPETAYVRGKVLLGPAPKLLEQLARDNAASWSITNGTLNIVRADSVLPSQAVVVNGETGMLGAPEVSGKGIKVKMELNPMVVPNGMIVLDNSNIKIQANQLYTNGPKIKEKKLVRLDPDGRYKVFKLRHQGDTRGADWYTEAQCIGLGQPLPKRGSQ